MVKKQDLWFDYYDAPEGTGALIFSQKGLRFLVLPIAGKSSVNEILARGYPTCSHCSCTELTQLKQDLFSYFSGRGVDFHHLELELDLVGFSHFEQDVYSAVKSIPYGEIWSYQQVALRIKKPRAYRAVGNALSKNPLPVLIPCHRIVRSDQSIGGFSAGLGWKRKLLELERCKRRLK